MGADSSLLGYPSSKGETGPPSVDQMRMPAGRRVTVPQLPLLTWQGAANDCGPHALAMASSCVLRVGPSPERCAELLALFRVPGLGATAPIGIPVAAAKLGLRVRVGLLGLTSDLRASVDAGRPVVVLVHPSEHRRRWWALHYRVVVGYETDEFERLSRLLLACSATPHVGERGWNVAQTPTSFQAEWHNWMLPRWYAEISNGQASA